MRIEKRNLRTDKQGVTGWTILIVIVLILVSWEIAGIYVDIPTPSSIINPKPDQVYFNITFKNKVTNAIFDPSPPYWPHNEITTPSSASYDMILRTNAPATLTGNSYRLVYSWWVWNDTSSQFENIPAYNIIFQIGWQGYFTDKFTLDTPVYSGTSFIVKTEAYTPGGGQILINQMPPPYEYLGLSQVTFLGVLGP